ncbi:hypothetical protein BH09SUM1_BH09SUM1_11770 [soil metagenome]
MSKKAFTLIELLIVVAIIAILAAIAVPNFLEAQVRAKTARCKSDMRTLALALESYAVDYNRYPYDGYHPTASYAPEYNYWYIPKNISTPIAYLTTAVWPDTFRAGKSHPTAVDWQIDNYRYTNWDSTYNTMYASRTLRTTVSTVYGTYITEFGNWRLNGAGPDKSYGPTGWVGVAVPAVTGLAIPYDATNGTVSAGDIIRSQRSPNGYINTR